MRSNRLLTIRNMMYSWRNRQGSPVFEWQR
jgi:hypothetical protein